MKNKTIALKAASDTDKILRSYWGKPKTKYGANRAIPRLAPYLVLGYAVAEEKCCNQ